MAAAMIAALVSRPRAALAQEPARTERPIAEALELEPSACFDRDSLGRELTRWLHSGMLDARLSIRVRRGQHSNAEAESFVVLREGTIVVERDLPRRNAPCEELRSAVALAIAIAVETTLFESREEPRAAPAAPIETAPIPDQIKAPLPKSKRGLSAEVLGHAFLGLLPRPAWGAEAATMIPLIGPLHGRVSFVWVAPRAISLGGGESELSLWAGKLGACWVGAPGSVEWRFCAGGAAGQLAAQGSGYARSLSPGLPWAAADASIETRFAISRRLGATFGLTGFVALARPALEVRNANDMLVASQTLPRGGGSLAAGLDMHFW
jgi:hypothetical protein